MAEVLFRDVDAFGDLEFTYGADFSKVTLRQPPPKALQGEVDYVLWPDQSTCHFEHIEAAVKFYLASKEKAPATPRIGLETAVLGHWRLQDRPSTEWHGM